MNGVDDDGCDSIDDNKQRLTNDDDGGMNE